VKPVTHPPIPVLVDNPIQRMALWYCFRLLPALSLISLILLVLSASPARALERDLSELAGGQMLLSLQDGETRPALLHHSHLSVRVSGMVAVISLRQSFENSSDQWVEGVYVFPLPEEAAVRSLEMEIGERRIVGQIREKAEARAEFEAARKAGKKTSLVEQQRPNLFSNRVANLAPRERLSVTLEYVQPVSYRDGLFSLRLPTTLTARYMPGVTTGEEEAYVPDPLSGWALPTSEVPDADRISPYQHTRRGSDAAPLNPLSLSAEIDMGMPLARLETPYHNTAVERRATRYELAFVGGTAEMDRDVLLQWAPAAGSEPQAALFTEQVGGERYGLLMLVPPSSAPEIVPRELVFVVDTSGSMGGVSIEQARVSVGRALRQLRSDDYFNVIEFNSHYRKLFRDPVPATQHNVGRALEFVRQLQASGGTEMLPALREALDQQQELHAGRLRQVVFVTDGAVGNEVALFEEIASRLGHARLFTVGIGSAPNGWFMRKAADFGRGTHTVIGDIAEVGPRMDALFQTLSAPVATDISVAWPVESEAWPSRVPDLYQGEPLMLAVKLEGDAADDPVLVSGVLAGQRWQREISLSAAEASSHPGIASLWARSKIAALLDERVLGRKESEVRRDVLAVALPHQLLSPYTSFVAVDEVVSRPPGDEMPARQVPNSPPRGQAAQHFAWPSTATSAPLKIYLGSFCLFLALLVCILRRPEVDHVPAAAS